MASEVDVGGSGALFIGEDKTFRLEVLDSNEAPVDISGWTIQLLVRLRETSQAALLTKTATISGVFNADRTVNAQRAIVEVADTEISEDAFDPRMYRYSFKRLDDGSETILAYGNFVMQRATQV